MKHMSHFVFVFTKFCFCPDMSTFVFLHKLSVSKNMFFGFCPNMSTFAVTPLPAPVKLNSQNFLAMFPEISTHNSD